MNGDNTLLDALRNESTRREAFSELVRTHQQQLYNSVRRIVVLHEDADDVLQNTFIKAWQALDTFRGDSSISTWLYRIAMHEALDHLESKRRHNGLSIDDDRQKAARALAAQLESDPYFDGDETEIRLQEAIAQLPNKQRLVFHMKYYDEMKYEDISAVLGTSVGALKASYHHAVQKIAAFFNLKD